MTYYLFVMIVNFGSCQSVNAFFVFDKLRSNLIQIPSFFYKETLRFVRLRPRHIYDFIFEPIKIKSKILSSFRFFLSAFVRCTNKISYSMPRCRSFHHLKQMLFLFLSHYFVVVTEILLLSRVVNRSFRSFYFPPPQWQSSYASIINFQNNAWK